MQKFTGMEYLKIDIANQFGLDRLKWKDRIHWVNNNRPDLHLLSEQAKYPILYRKALRAFDRGLRGESINHSMGLDATASGVQMLAAMSGCVRAARTVNLVNTGEREDLYESVSEEMNDIQAVTTSRDILKKPIMTFFYGSEAVPKQIFGEGAGLAAFYQAMSEGLPGPYQLMQLFQSQWDPQATEYRWVMPDGHQVHVPVSFTEERAIEIDEADHLRFHYRTEVNKPQQKGRALAANITHSVDAYACRMMVRMAHDQRFSMAPVHDCFYAHPNHMNKLRANYQAILGHIASMNLVSQILTQIKGHHVYYKKLSTDLPVLISESEYSLS